MKTSEKDLEIKRLRDLVQRLQKVQCKHWSLKFGNCTCCDQYTVILKGASK